MTIVRFFRLPVFLGCALVVIAQISASPAALSADAELQTAQSDPNLVYTAYDPTGHELIVDRAAYFDKFHGFWLGQSIANWTGLITELDKVGGPGIHGQFYTRDNWGGPDHPAIWAIDGAPSEISPVIDFVLRGENEVWGADDDTDIEYMYLNALYASQTSILTPQQIRQSWLDHIYDETKPTPFGKEQGAFQNYLWVSNQRAHTLMLEGVLPPETSAPENNPHWDMIDAQLTTEIFGLFAPGRPDKALVAAYLPIRVTARKDAAWAAEFYVIMHALASQVDDRLSMAEKLRWMAQKARLNLPTGSYSAAMYDFVKSEYDTGHAWETVRDSLYETFQVNQEHGYDISSRGLYCNGCFASGINFGASLISLFFGEGDFKETIKIAVLCGWDSDNPAATWGGLLGFMIGKTGIEEAFGKKLSNQFHIHRTRRGFANAGLDRFDDMAQRGVFVTDRAVQEHLQGGVDLKRNVWLIPRAK